MALFLGCPSTRILRTLWRIRAPDHPGGNGCGSGHPPPRPPCAWHRGSCLPHGLATDSALCPKALPRNLRVTCFPCFWFLPRRRLGTEGQPPSPPSLSPHSPRPSATRRTPAPPSPRMAGSASLLPNAVTPAPRAAPTTTLTREKHHLSVTRSYRSAHSCFCTWLLRLTSLLKEKETFEYWFWFPQARSGPNTTTKNVF